MSKMLAYIKLRYKLQFARDKTQDKRAGIFSWLLMIIAIAAVILLLGYFFDIISLQFLDSISPKDFLTFIYSVLGVVLIIVSVSKELKMFLFQNDFNIEARFPLSDGEMFASQLIIVFVDVLTVSIVTTLPVVIMFGISAEIISVSFVFLSLLSAVLLPLVPFSISLLITIPVMGILNLLENKNILKLIIFIFLIMALFALYSIVLDFLAEYYISKRVDATEKENFIVSILSFNNGWNFFSYPSCVNFGENVAGSIGIYLSVFVVIMTIGILVALPVYGRAKENMLEGKKKIFEKNSSVTQDRAFSAIFKKEFKEIIRTHTYAYFYLGIALVMPVMVFLTNEIIRKVGTAQLGVDITFSTSLIVVFAFISMINAFAGSTVSREGREFYVTKISPVGYRYQLLSKGLLNNIISLIAVLMSVIILCVMKFLPVSWGLFLLLIAVLFSVGSVFTGLNISVRFPSLSGKTGGAESQSNSILTMIIGLIICMIEGACAIVLSFFMDMSIVFVILFAISFLYSLINTLLFIFTVNKKYSAIE